MICAPYLSIGRHFGGCERAHAVWNAKERREKALELNQANWALQEEKEKLQLILDSAAEAIYGIDLEGHCTFCNQSCLRFWDMRIKAICWARTCTG